MAMAWVTPELMSISKNRLLPAAHNLIEFSLNLQSPLLFRVVEPFGAGFASRCSLSLFGGIKRIVDMLAFATADLAISLLELFWGYPEGGLAFRALTKHDELFRRLFAGKQHPTIPFVNDLKPDIRRIGGLNFFGLF